MRCLIVSLAAVLTGGVVTGQVGGGGGMGATGSGSGTGGQTGVQANPAIGAGAAARTSDLMRPIFISGKVMTQDGSPLPQAVTIQRMCGGVSRTVAYVDGRGHFSFQWNDRNTIVTDASDAGGSRTNAPSSGFGGAQSSGGSNSLSADPFSSRMMNCELRANAPGFTSDGINLFNRRSSDSPDVGIIVLHRIAGVEGRSVSITAMLAPKDAKKAYDRGLQSLLKSKADESARELEKAVAAYPKYADAWVSLGRARLQLQSADAAREAFAKAIEADPKLVAPYTELGLLAARESKWEESRSWLEQALKLDPIEYPQVWYTAAVANYNLQRYDAAERAAREAVRLDPHHANPRSDYLLGLTLAEKHEYPGAASELEMYLQLSPNAPDAAQVRIQLAQLEKLSAAAKQPAAQTAQH